MNIDCNVIIFNPTKEAINNINHLADIFRFVYVEDNTEDEDNIFYKFSKDNIIYKYYKENKGVAEALNDGLLFASKNKADFLLTLDQDSVYPYQLHDYVIQQLKSVDMNKEAVISITPYPVSKKEEFEYVKYPITSGSILNVNLLIKNNIRFNNDLFIDSVDFDFDEKIYKNNLRIKQLNRVSLKHTMGNPIKKKILFLTFFCLNHNPIRYYYRYRNITYLYRNNKKFYKKLYWREMIVQKLKLIFFESDKKEKPKMIKLGISDGIRGKLGKFIPEKENDI